MDISIIINTFNQYQFLDRCIDSCKNQNFHGSFEVIVVDSSKNLSEKKKFYKKYSEINLIEVNELSPYPCVNQMECIKIAFQKSKGEIILLLDGDDFFEENKLTFINQNFYNKCFINQDKPNYYIEKNKLKKKTSSKQYKKNKLYKKIFNSWENVFGTSAISLDRKTFENFFQTISNTTYNLLAIDTLLIFYATQKGCYNELGSNLTVKSINNQNLDKKYSNFFSKNFWVRRMQQHNCFKRIQNYLNLDYLITKMINYFL